MKKFLFLFTFFVILSYIPCFAETESPDISGNIVYTQFSAEEQKILFDRSLYKESMNDISLEGKPILVQYYLRWEFADRSLLEMKAQGEEEALHYIVFDDEIYEIFRDKTEEGFIFGLYMGNDLFVGKNKDVMPMHLQDLLACENNVCTINGEEYIYTNVICFDSNTNYDGILMYYETLDGTFVRYYRDAVSEAIDFTIEQFRDYAAGYYEYKLSHPAIDKDGNILAGRNLSFADYVNLPPETPDAAQLTTPEKINPVFFYVAGIATVSVIVIFVCILLRRKNKSA